MRLPVISLDQLRETLAILPEKNQGRVVQEAKKQAREYLAQKCDFVWNATNITRPMRNQLIDLFLSYGASVRVIYCETPLETALARNAARPRQLPRNAIQEMANKLDVPKVWEAEQLTHCINE